jgi:hypothetical protein
MAIKDAFSHLARAAGIGRPIGPHTATQSQPASRDHDMKAQLDREMKTVCEVIFARAANPELVSMHCLTIAVSAYSHMAGADAVTAAFSAAWSTSAATKQHDATPDYRRAAARFGRAARLAASDVVDEPASAAAREIVAAGKKARNELN